MKICPACQTTYTDETLRFCMRDGTPLENAEAPQEAKFEDEATVVSSNLDREPKMVVPLQTEPEPQTQVEHRIATPTKQPQPPARKSKAPIILLSILGLFAVLGVLGLGAWWLLGKRDKNEIATANANSSANTNVNRALNTNAVFNANLSDNANVNGNLNANAKTPTPTPTRTPTPTPTPANRNANLSNANAGINANTINGNVNARPMPTPTPNPTPRPEQPTTVSGGIVNGKATSLPKPAYPAPARALRASGQVQVQVLIDENGRVVSAQAITGHPLLRGAAESAARQARFQPTLLSGQPVKVSGTIVYNFNIAN